MAFEDMRVHVRLKLSALWSSLMFFYIYADYFQLWQPGHSSPFFVAASYRIDILVCAIPVRQHAM